MITFHNDKHAQHHGKLEMFRGELVPCFEKPDRVDHVLRELKRRGIGPIETAPPFPDSALTRVHSQRYVDFLAGAWDEWVALDPANAQRDAMP
jgi:acetoin utilization deacetylase AcuC-like enzyme